MSELEDEELDAIDRLIDLGFWYGSETVVWNADRWNKFVEASKTCSSYQVVRTGMFIGNQEVGDSLSAIAMGSAEDLLFLPEKDFLLYPKAKFAPIIQARLDFGDPDSELADFLMILVHIFGGTQIEDEFIDFLAAETASAEVFTLCALVLGPEAQAIRSRISVEKFDINPAPWLAALHQKDVLDHLDQKERDLVASKCVDIGTLDYLNLAFNLSPLETFSQVLGNPYEDNTTGKRPDWDSQDLAAQVLEGLGPYDMIWPTDVSEDRQQSEFAEYLVKILLRDPDTPVNLVEFENTVYVAHLFHEPTTVAVRKSFLDLDVSESLFLQTVYSYVRQPPHNLILNDRRSHPLVDFLVTCRPELKTRLQGALHECWSIGSFKEQDTIAIIYTQALLQFGVDLVDAPDDLIQRLKSCQEEPELVGLYPEASPLGTGFAHRGYPTILAPNMVSPELFKDRRRRGLY